VREFALLPAPRAVVCLGGFAWDAALRILAARGDKIPRPRPRFAHGAEASVGGMVLLGCYHPSQQNTFTGRLKPGMMEDVLRRAAELAGREIRHGRQSR
jgi:uracil-DNA glycosylase